MLMYMRVNVCVRENSENKMEPIAFKHRLHKPAIYCLAAFGFLSKNISLKK